MVAPLAACNLRFSCDNLVSVRAGLKQTERPANSTVAVNFGQLVLRLGTDSEQGFERLVSGTC